MHRGSMVSIPRLLLLLLSVIVSTITFSQPPPTTNPSGVPTINTPPVNLTNPQLQSVLADGNNTDAGKDRNADLYKNNKVYKDSLTDNSGSKNEYSPKNTYGANVFSNAAQTNVAELSTPPLDYPIGVGDEIIVSLYGGAEFQNNYVVGSDGSIFPKGMGKIYVGGLVFENVRRLLYSRFSAVVPVGTNIDIALGKPRTININVVNEVNNPGIYTVSAFSNAFNVIAKAGGVTNQGNLRNIQIKRNGRVIEELDVYKYLQTGDFGKHIYLQNNDFIIVPFYEKKVLVTGEFKRPMYYQLRKDEGVKALLKYSGGLNSGALASNLKIVRVENESQIIRDINANAILKIAGQDELLKDGDILKADLVKNGIINKVEIKGEVKYPDTYEYRDGDKLFDLINRAGGVTRNTYLNRAYVFRGAGDSTSLQSDRLEVDLTDISNNNILSKNNVALQPNDVVLLFGSYEFSEPINVEIFGEVRKPGTQRKYGGMTLQDLLYLSGGLKPSAEFGRLEISSIVDVDSARKGLKPTRTVVKSYAIDQNLQIDSAAAQILMKPYDQVLVRKNPTFELQQNIEIKGLVKYPGLYPRLDKYEKLSSYIARAGGFKENANLSGAVLYRRKTENLREKQVSETQYDSVGNAIETAKKIKNIDEPVSIDLYKALKYKNSKFDIILQENDIIFIPEINPFVSVEGKVQSPLKIVFDKEHTNVAFYVDKAGGFGIRPWKRRVFVTYANGKSKRTKNFFFFHFYPRVEEGSVITIPGRPEGQEITDVIRTTATSLVPVLVTALILKYIN
ncbi:SLBB domain-containing protein [Ferruginibacter yonginensis]|uniref:SLBB domain-containing protein n=1 Tax=Ferruginibacter yonginensis TaxID=1310416 RepID=A0ABV8QUR6_9BACT